MDKFLKPRSLPGFAVGAGAMGILLRTFLYRLCLDEKGLLVTNYPLEWLLWAVTASALGVIIASVWKLDGSDRYEDNFAPSPRAAVGHVLAGMGFLLTVLLNEPRMYGILGTLWKLLGILSFPCLMVAGIVRAKGKCPFFGLHIVPCLFLVFHIINHYQLWSGNPQLQDYVFDLFAVMALMLFSYYTAAFEADSGKRRMHLGMGLAAIYLCMVAISGTEYLFLYAGGLFWAQSDLCNLAPKPRAPEPQEGEVPNDPA